MPRAPPLGDTPSLGARGGPHERARSWRRGAPHPVASCAFAQPLTRPLPRLHLANALGRTHGPESGDRERRGSPCPTRGGERLAIHVATIPGVHHTCTRASLIKSVKRHQHVLVHACRSCWPHAALRVVLLRDAMTSLPTTPKLRVPSHAMFSKSWHAPRAKLATAMIMRAAVEDHQRDRPECCR